eukprot:5668015-Pyramimonas_sp.AAC.1
MEEVAARLWRMTSQVTELIHERSVRDFCAPSGAWGETFRVGTSIPWTWRADQRPERGLTAPPWGVEK